MEQIFQDVPRWYTALAEWCACVMFIVVLRKRYSQKKIALIAMGVLVIQILFMTMTGNLPLVWWVPCMGIAVGIMFFFLYSCCQYSLVTIGYCCVRAFMYAEFAASLGWQIYCYLRVERNLIWAAYVMLGLVYIAAFTLIWKLEQSIMKEYDFIITLRELGASVLIVLFAFLFSNLSFLGTDMLFTSRNQEDVFAIRTLVDLGGAVVLYAYQSRICELNVKNELLSIGAVLKNQYDQYRHYQENMELIRIKNHDMKHQIAGLRGEADPEKRMQWLDSLEKELECNDIPCETGNAVLDAIVSSKMAYCNKNDIKFTQVIDGSKLDFISVSDICTIFGNAIDNAMESVLFENDKDKRIIHLSVSAQKNFLYIRIENCCSQSLAMVNGLPETTKKNKSEHGFGLKSIRYTVEKYQGQLSIQEKDGWFELKILIPHAFQDK
ncbi:MAG: GHKL domain-containing protein [Lachnospiraceae bacterium]|nr:GHKL domain-containing protein [Lachnospiraceae bacterium]MDD3617079.1 GHKL domain-containing protein [Lachnospiraceae bacterium]